ncbi:Quinone oxidoreductase protein, partial [Globisporangium splendens]
MTPTPSTFQAYVFENYGDPLQEIKLRTDFPQSALQPTDVRIKVHATALNPIDYKVVDHGAKYLPTGPSAETPFRLGHDVAGTIVEIGVDVKNFRIGDAVYAKTYFGSLGTFAEYIDLDTKFVALKPRNLTFNQAAGVPLASQTSYQALVNYGNIKEGDRVLVLGGSSGTGAFAIQIAKALGASFIAATTSARNHELVKSFGADRVINYTSERWVDVLDAHSIDIIYDCGAEPNAWNTDAQRVLKRDTGKFVTILTTENPIESPIGAAFFKMMTNPASVDLPAITKLIDAGKIFTPIDSVHKFENLLDAIRIQMSNRARGKIILEVLPDQK